MNRIVPDELTGYLGKGWCRFLRFLKLKALPMGVNGLATAFSAEVVVASTSGDSLTKFSRTTILILLCQNTCHYWLSCCLR